MGLTDLKISEYLCALKSDAPAPGGGTASAIAGAQGAALVAMVLSLTLGKEKYVKFHKEAQEAKTQAEELLAAFSQAAAEDTLAYNMVAAAYKMPKETDEQKKARSDAIQEGMLVATEVPFAVMKKAFEGIVLVSGITGKTNPNAESDLGVAVLNLLACTRGAWLNVKINLPGIKDLEKAEYYKNEGLKICEEAARVAEESCRMLY